VTTSPEEQFRTAYDACLDRWPAGVEAVDVPSRYGTTRVNVCGPADAPPLVLLPGGGATSMVWTALAGPLSGRFRLYAVDILCDTGAGSYDGEPMAGVDGLMSWLAGVLDHFGLDDPYLCGHSYGGWIALNYALGAARRVARLALLDPTTCFAGMSARYLVHAVPVLAGTTPHRVRALIEWETGNAELDPGWLHLVLLGAGLPRPKLVIGGRPSRDRLRRLDVPTLLVLAGNSRAHNIRQVSANARRLVPDLTGVVAAGTTHHAMPMQHQDELGRVLAAFFAPP
jgi:pimeloyl-ACP methyl ester carboxylesterase